MIAYTSHQFRQVCQLSTKSLMLVSREVYYILMQLDICYAKLSHTGTTRGQCRLRALPATQAIVTTTMNYVVKHTGVNNANLIILISSESRNGSITAPSCSDRSLTSAVICLLLIRRAKRAYCKSVLSSLDQRTCFRVVNTLLRPQGIILPQSSNTEAVCNVTTDGVAHVENKRLKN